MLKLFGISHSSLTIALFRNIFAEHYALGKFITAKKLHNGYVNLSYQIDLLRDGMPQRYILRCYRKGVHRKKVLFEHALLKQLSKRHFRFSPAVVETKNGKSYVKLQDCFEKGRKQEYYFAIFNFLQGEDKFCWNQPLLCIDEEVADAARVLALYHTTIFDWNMKRTCEKPEFMEYIPEMTKKWRHYAQKAGTLAFDTYFLDHIDQLLTYAKRMLSSLGTESYQLMPRVAIHGDYHPGNLKFLNARVSGMFDFDWAKKDTRCFDVALAVNYFCSSWDNADNGVLQLDRVETFLKAYQKAARNSGRLGALNVSELHYFPEMMMMSNLSIIDWTVKNFYTTQSDSEEYETYLQHNVQQMNWIEQHRKTLKKCIITYRVTDELQDKVHKGKPKYDQF